MICLTDEQLHFLEKFVPESIKFLRLNNLGDFLSSIDDAIVHNIMNNDLTEDEPDDLGIQIQKVYDQIYNLNFLYYST